MKPGFLILDKPIGARSSYCVDRVRKALGRDVKVGHGGTLDSSASGLLVLLVAGATRLSNLVMGMRKIYRVAIRLGLETTTCDYTGETTHTSGWDSVTERAIDSHFFSFLGWRLQTPPKISAVHIDGRRAHEIYRSGGDPNIQPRPVLVTGIKRLSPISRDGIFEMLVTCGKGTYVRSIVRDLGRLLGCGAHVAALRRERVGCFSLEDAIVPPEDFSFDRDRLVASILSIDAIAQLLPCYAADSVDAERLRNGVRMPLASARRISLGQFPPDDVVAVDTERLFTIGRLDRDADEVFVVPETNIQRNGENVSE
ncbi:tRNA pseudouridine(55) synthase TruB [Synergistaceae bacterium OttesenSCG-928-I11]|nr:tRNA pseudouridine(55) synthase TruB [Synergistaceae bacterium OttesenSCG-928-I11]